MARGEHGSLFQKKYLALVLSGALPLLFAACGGTDTTGPLAQESFVSEPIEEDQQEIPNFTALKQTSSETSQISIAAAVTADPSQYHLKGHFGPLHNWPVMPIAMMLLPDGRVLGYGSDPQGKQGALMKYTVWNPEVGINADAFTVLDNYTNTDIFCSGQAMIGSGIEAGQPLLVGGDTIVNKKRNYGVSDVNTFNPKTNTLVKQKSMAYKRWYATAVTLANGQHVALGGRDKIDKPDGALTVVGQATFSPTPEVRDANGNWRKLTNATSDLVFGKGSPQNNAWFYPRAWTDPKGGVFVLSYTGDMYNLNTNGTGALTQYTPNKKAPSSASLPSVMFAPGKVLVLSKLVANVVDFNGATPVVTSGGKLSAERRYGSLTVLADGKVWLNGGSTTGNEDGHLVQSEMWNPANSQWTPMANGTRPRLYHSASMLLMDGSVLTGGSGAAPNMNNELNGEIYYPPYLFDPDGSGDFAYRPEILTAPTYALKWNVAFNVTADEKIMRATLVRAGAVTHTLNNETRFFELPVTSLQADGKKVSLKTPANANLAPPGYYMLFVWNDEGVPSVAKMIRIA